MTTTDTSDRNSTRWLYGDRARRWGCSPFLAEWFSNTVEYCKSYEGKKGFQAWLLSHYGQLEGQRLLELVNGPPAQPKSGKFTGNAKLFNAAAVDFGISVIALEKYQWYAGWHNLCYPPRTLPAIHRRRGESSAEWLARRQEADLNGHKPPDIDLSELRRIAMSQLDAVRDLMALWRSEPLEWLDRLMRRAKSYLRADEIKHLKEQEQLLYTAEHAFKKNFHLAMMSHVLWYRAVRLFEDLDALGLKTPAAIERAYQRDSRLMWRLVAIAAYSVKLGTILKERTEQVVSYCEHFRPYFKRYRDKRGRPHLEPDEAYIRSHPFRDNLLDEVIVRMLCEKWSPNIFFEHVLRALRDSPRDGDKFDADAYEEMGELAIAGEFEAALTKSAFGQNLRAASLAAYSKLDAWEKQRYFYEISYMKPGTVEIPPPKPELDFGHAQLATACGNKWLEIIWEEIDVYSDFIYMGRTPDPIQGYEQMWMIVDKTLWRRALQLDCGDRQLIDSLGLFDPNAAERPSFFAVQWKKATEAAAQDERDARRAQMAAVPNPPSDGALPSVTPTEPAATSGHAYVTTIKDTQPKEKVKTRPVAGTQPDHTNGIPAEDVEINATDQEIEEDVPETLPSVFYVPRKVAKVFHRVLDPAPEDNSAATRKGQVRWGDFEKAMRRIGFTVVQGVGSSVRFDAPAKAARPIMFHRPHPDSTITPYLSKIVGARLRRCYGWTLATFELKAGNDAED